MSEGQWGVKYCLFYEQTLYLSVYLLLLLLSDKLGLVFLLLLRLVVYSMCVKYFNVLYFCYNRNNYSYRL